MWDKLFAKYARAVSNERERQALFRKFQVKTVVSVIFYVLCVVLIVLAVALRKQITQNPVPIVMAIVIVAWIGFAVADFCLWVSFKKTYNAILKRPATPNEMPEITTYRQKTVQDKKVGFKKLWWAWLVFALCVAAFIACMVAEAVKNPDGEQFGIWGGVAFGVLLVGALTLAFAYILYGAFKQQNGETIEQQTESEAKAIDAAQGRKHPYQIQSDANLQTYRYLFPDRELYAKAESVRKKCTKILSRGILVFSVLAMAAAVLFLCSAKLGKNLAGYALPSAVTLLFAGIAPIVLVMNRKLAPIEAEQKKRLQSDPEYAENYAWYCLYENFGKCKGKVYLLFLLIGLALSWVLAVLFPATAWSCTGIIPMMIGLFVNNKLVKDLRRKAIPLEKEIDRKMLTKLYDTRFYLKGSEADEDTAVAYDGDSLMPQTKASGEITLYLGETSLCMEVRKEDSRVVNVSSGQIRLSEIPTQEIPLPQNAQSSTLYARLDPFFSRETCGRIRFDGGERYDPHGKNYLVGNTDEARPWYRIFRNVYVQLSEEQVLLSVLCTGIEEQA